LKTIHKNKDKEYLVNKDRYKDDYALNVKEVNYFLENVQNKFINSED